MTHDGILSRGVMASLALTLASGVPLTSIRADVVQPLPRPAAASTGDEARWLERLPPATQPLPRPIEVAQSDTCSLQEALKLLESRVESGAFESAPSTVENDAPQTRQSAQAVEPPDESSIPVAPALPVAPESIEPVPTSFDAAPERMPDSPSPNTRTIEDAPSSMPETPPAVSVAPPVPSREESREDTGRAPLETASETIAGPAAPSASGGRWQVQLLAGRSLSRVERDRDDLRRFHGDRVAGLTLTISQASPNGLYRLRALDWPSRAEAGVWCKDLRAATGLKCLVVRGDESPEPGSAPVDTSPSPATR
ncbi:SPOR domain-containing protein [Allochromatium vinosum]|uniref:Sporulation domain protein n=1 Tax=Allochromatium vinosum (strain ATCC 17899 / DSM 180 / NBRC 103801 / NCIMB 10441 / D) TaxID=572477 RepID=D3RPT2_ALLVD|nr:SPOR domain-containing protein [Allochromatium vinosum]ADC61664.1 Sporulation domain protein [Allochromatium vinosum DSM 180]